MNYKISAVIGDFIYIVNMTKPGTNREINKKKTLEEQKKFCRFAHMFNQFTYVVNFKVVGSRFF